MGRLYLQIVFHLTLLNIPLRALLNRAHFLHVLYLWPVVNVTSHIFHVKTTREPSLLWILAKMTRLFYAHWTILEFIDKKAFFIHVTIIKQLFAYKVFSLLHIFLPFSLKEISILWWIIIIIILPVKSEMSSFFQIITLPALYHHPSRPMSSPSLSFVTTLSALCHHSPTCHTRWVLLTILNRVHNWPVQQ